MATERERERERERKYDSVSHDGDYPHKISFSYHVIRHQMISHETNKGGAIVQITNKD
jgi:hypothetical protein